MKLKISIVGAIGLLFFSFVAKTDNYKYSYIFPDLVGTIGGKEEEVLGIYDFSVDSEEKIFIAERYNNQIVVYSNQGEQLYTFGRKGKGPGEFLTPFRICVYDDKVFVADHGNRRIQIFTRKGDYVGNFRYPQSSFRAPVYIDALEDKLFFISNSIERKKGLWSFDWGFWLSDLNGNIIKNFLTYTTFMMYEPGYTIPALIPAHSKTSRDRIFIVDNEKDVRYKIFIYSSSGEKMKKIQRAYKVRKVPLAMKEYMEAQIKNSVKEAFIAPMGVEWKLKILFPEYLPAIRDIAIDGDKLLVRTWEDWWKAVKKDESKRRYEIDMYSTEGEYLGRGITNLGLQRTIFTKNFVYEMTQTPPYYENVIHVYKRPK